MASWLTLLLLCTQSKAIGDADFSQLLDMLQAQPGDERLPALETAAQFNFFSSAQARDLVQTLSNSFDKARGRFGIAVSVK
jgi:hypothetical protein